MNVFRWLLAAALAGAACAVAAAGPYGPPISQPQTLPAYSVFGPATISASCGTTAYNSCPANSVVGIQANGTSSVSVQVAGTYSATLQIESALDCVNFTPLALTPQTGGSATSTITTTGIWSGGISPQACIQVRGTAYTSGAATVTLAIMSAGGGGVASGGGGTFNGVITGPTSAPGSVFTYPYANQSRTISATDGTSCIALSTHAGIFINGYNAGPQQTTAFPAVYNNNTCTPGTNNANVIMGDTTSVNFPALTGSFAGTPFTSGLSAKINGAALAAGDTFTVNWQGFNP